MKTQLFLIFFFFLLAYAVSASVINCSTVIMNDSFNYADAFTNHGWSYQSSYPTESSPILDYNPFNERCNGLNDSYSESIFSRTLTRYPPQNYSTGKYGFIINVSYQLGGVNPPFRLIFADATHSYSSWLELTKQGAYTNVSVEWTGVVEPCSVLQSYPFTAELSLFIDLDADTYSFYINDSLKCENKALEADLEITKIQLQNTIDDFQTVNFFSDDFYFCEAEQCSLSHPALCEHVGGYCMDGITHCSDAFIYDGGYYCEIQDIVVCECNTTSNSCVNNEICSANMERCCTNETACADYDTGGNLYICSPDGLSWLLEEVCSYGCTETGDAYYSFCSLLTSYYCYVQTQNRCVISSVNATGYCWLTYAGCTDYIEESGAPQNASVNIPTGSNDLAETIQLNYCTFGLCSTASKIIAGLVIMLVIAVMIIVFSVSYQVTPNFAIIGVVEFILMILLTYIGLLPIWIPIILTIFSIGVFAFMVISKLQGG